LICVSAAVVPVFANNTGQIVIRENVSDQKRQELAAQLRTITGWTNLRFDENGILRLGLVATGNGSESARSLLSRAVQGDRVIVIEDASSRHDVAFCRVVPARWLSGSGTNLPAYVVMIDFSDFRQIIGDDKALAAFNVGWGFMHELDHVVSDSTDADQQGLLGECENHINAMREEVGLPLRMDYFFTESSLRTDPNFRNKLVKLAFDQYDSHKARKRRYWLVWDSIAVGGLVTNGQTAAVRSAPHSPK
jgi:hypothetical protein